MNGSSKNVALFFSLFFPSLFFLILLLIFDVTGFILHLFFLCIFITHDTLVHYLVVK